MTQSKPDTMGWQEPPYRTDVLEADFEEVRRLNEDQDRSGAQAFEHAIMAERRINQAKSAARSRLESWTEHPDERVQIALVRRANSTSTPWTGNDEPYLREALLSRLLANANATGHVWTKALDRLEGSHLYPVWHSNIDGLEYPWGRLDEEARDDAPAYETPDERLDRLIPWIEAQDEVEPLLDLFHSFSSRRLYERIARHARPLGKELFDVMIGAHARLGAEFARNPNLTDVEYGMLEEWALAGITSKLPSSDGRILPPFGRYAPRPEFAEDTLEALEETAALSDDTLAILVSCVTPWDPTEEQRRYDISADDEAQRAAALNLLLYAAPDRVTEAQLFQLYESVKNEADRVVALVRHPEATVSFWRHVLDDSRVQRVRAFLASRPEARADADIRETLSSSVDADVVRHLMVDAARDDRPRLFRILVEKQPMDALEFLKEAEDVSMLSATDFAPLAESASASIAVSFLLTIRDMQFSDVSGGDVARRHLSGALQRLAADKPHRARQVLDERADDLKGLIEPADLKPLLNAEDRGLRVAAITTLSRLGFALPGGEMAPTLPGRTKERL